MWLNATRSYYHDKQLQNPIDAKGLWNPVFRFSVFFSKFLHCAGRTGALRAARKAKKKHLQSFGNGFQRTANAKCFRIGEHRVGGQRENPGVTDGAFGE